MPKRLCRDCGYSRGMAAFRLLIRACLPAVLAFAAAAGAADAASVFPGENWSTRAAEAATPAWSADKLKAADELARSLRSDAYLVVQGGQVVHSYGDIATPMNLASVRKSVLSILFGIHAGRKEIDLDQTLAALEIGDRQPLTDTERSATVRQLLQAQSGVYHPAAYETADMKAHRPARGSHAPGTFWYYNNWDFNVLGTVFQRRTGQTVFQALESDLALPLQFQDFRPARDTQWVLERASEHPAYVMRISARDLARVGLLMARKGTWNGRQLVAPEWIAQSTRASTTRPRALLGYGYLWWTAQPSWVSRTGTSPQSFLGAGNGGQFLFIDPVRDLVVVHRVDNDRFFLQRSEVSLNQFADLLARIVAAMPP